MSLRARPWRPAAGFPALSARRVLRESGTFRFPDEGIGGLDGAKRVILSFNNSF